MSYDKINSKKIMSLPLLGNMEVSKNETSSLHLSENSISDQIKPGMSTNKVEYENLQNEVNGRKTDICPINVESSNLNKTPFQNHITRSLPPRPVPQPRKTSNSIIQSSPGSTKVAVITPMRHSNGGRCNSPSPSIISNSSACSQQSHTFQRCKHLHRVGNDTSTLKRPHVLHRKCALNITQLEKLSNDGPVIDIVIVYSKMCQVSADWARYFKTMFESASYASHHIAYTLKDTGNNSVKVQLQEIEEFSDKVSQMNSPSNRNSTIRQELVELEERTHHAKCHLVIVGYQFLEWVYRNPSLIIGTLFGSINIGPNESNPNISASTIGLLLGVTAKEVKTEHRAALLTFSQWNLMDIEEEKTHEGTQNPESETKPSFSVKLFKETMYILKQDFERRQEQHYRIPSSIHTPTSPQSPTQSVFQPENFASMRRIANKVRPVVEPTFKVLSTECDILCINALQRSIVILLSQNLCPLKDKIECYFVCMENKSKNGNCNGRSKRRDDIGNVTKPLPIISKPRSEFYKENKNESDSSSKDSGLEENEQGEYFSSYSRTSLPNDNLYLPPKRSSLRNSSTSKEMVNDYEVKKSSIKLELKRISSNVIEALITPKVFSRLSMFLSCAECEDDNKCCDRYIVFEVKVNGVPWNASKIPTKEYTDHENKGQLVNLETPMSTLERLMDTSTLLSGSTLNWVNGSHNAVSVGLDQNIASVISNSMPTNLFSWIINSRVKEDTMDVNSFDSMYPTLIHWAAYNGLDKAIVSLLNLPGAALAAQQLNCKGMTASDIAKVQGHFNLSCLIESKRKGTRFRSSNGRKENEGSSNYPAPEEMHVYEYPTVKFPLIENQNMKDDMRNNSEVFVSQLSNISPPPTPPTLSKMPNLKIEYEKCNRKSIQSSSSVESRTSLTNRSSTASFGLTETVNNNLYDVPRSCNQGILTSENSTSCTGSLINEVANNDALASVTPKDIQKNENSILIESNQTLETSIMIDEKTATSKNQKPAEYSYIPMQPRCNSTGQSVPNSSIASQNDKKEFSKYFNSMGRRKKSNSTSCISPPDPKNNYNNNVKQAADDSLVDDYHFSNSMDAPLVPPKHFPVVRSSPKARHEFMKTFCNFSNQEALLSDDYSPYIDKCDIKSLYGEATLSKFSSKDEKLDKVENPVVSEPKVASNVSVGFTPTLFTKLRKPIEKSESLSLPPKMPKRKGAKKFPTSDESGTDRKSTLNCSGSVKSISTNKKNKQIPQAKSGSIIEDLGVTSKRNYFRSGEVNKTPQDASDLSKTLDAEGISGNPIWTKLKVFSSGTLKRNKNRNRSENSTSS